MSSVKIVIWNVEWCKPGSSKANVILSKIFDFSPDIICLTEGCLGFLPDSGHLVSAQSDYGYANSDEIRRKVILWSKEPWSEIDENGDDSIPGGRYIGSQTTTPIGPIYCRGICIPWADAHVRTGRKDRIRWEDHESYIEGLNRIRSLDNKQKEIVIGDFNQRFPRKYQPKRLFEKLNAALKGLNVATYGVVDENGKSAIDHVTHSAALEVTETSVITNFTEDGKRLSDHFGIFISLSDNTMK